MLNKIVLILVGAALAVGLSACETKEHHDQRTVVDQVVVFDGHWTDDNDPNQGDSSKISAVIKDGDIRINLESTDSSALFWKGTFPKASQGPTKFVSQADVKALSESLLGSSDKKKTFTYEDGVLTFDLSMMGVTRHVHLEKQES